MRYSNLKTTLLAIFFCTAFVASNVHAADEFPQRPIKLIVQFPPGGTTDIIARLMSQGLSQELGQTVIVENRAGASGNIGSDQVAKSKPDGYTIGMATVTTHAINPFIRKMSFDIERDLNPIINLASVPNVLVIQSTIAASNVRELVAVLKANPGKYGYATAGIGAEGHIAMEAFNKYTNTQTLHVAYKGSAPAIQDTISGQTQIMIGNLPSLLPFIKAGKLKALAVTAPKSLSVIPEIPTFADVGFPQLNRASWFGLAAPAKTPAPILEKLNNAANKALSDPAIRSAIEKLGALPIGGTASAFAKVMKDEMDAQREVLRTTNIQVD